MACEGYCSVVDEPGLARDGEVCLETDGVVCIDTDGEVCLDTDGDSRTSDAVVLCVSWSGLTTLSAGKSVGDTPILILLGARSD